MIRSDVSINSRQPINLINLIASLAPMVGANKERSMAQADAILTSKRLKAGQTRG